MHGLLFLVRFVLRAIFGERSDSVAMAARIDGRVEQQRKHPGEESRWSLFVLGQRRNPDRRASSLGIRGRSKANPPCTPLSPPRDE